MRRELLPFLFLAATCGACAQFGRELARSDAYERNFPWSSPPLEERLSIRDGKSGAKLSLDELCDRLAQQEAVFLGETHIDETTHDVELAVLRELFERRGNVVLAMEMFERDVQATLDDYLASRIDEPTFLAHARPWSNYRTAYRPLVEYAKAHHIPVVASNFPAPLRMKIKSDGADALDALAPDERRFAPAKLLANTPGYWRRVDNAIRGHIGMMGPRPAADDPRLGSVQSLWDNTMGESAALALDAHKGALLVHVNGGFHSEYWDGTARQLKLRRPQTRVATVAISTSSSPATDGFGGLPVGDFVVFAEERARDLDEGSYAVLVPRKLEYRLSVPSAADDAHRVPLLVFLADDGENVADTFALWHARLSDECALAVIEAPYRELEADLVEGARWFWPDSFREDIGALRAGLERTWGYLLRRQPIDPARVVFAGEGTGATVVAATAMLSEGLPIQALALGPRRYSGIKDFPLPLTELRGNAPKAEHSLALRVDAADEEWWKGETAEYAAIDLPSVVSSFGADPWRAELERENAVRTALGLAPRTLAADAPRKHVVVSGPRMRAWARRIAFDAAKSGELVALLSAASEAKDSSEIPLAIHARDFAQNSKLPRAPGAFGGTTVVVLPDDLAPEELEAWQALAKDDPLAKKSRFHRLVLASASGERALPVVLAELAAKNRKNALIVPALWCADGTRMRALQEAAAPFEDRMTLHWRPGLGGLQQD